MKVNRSIEFFDAQFNRQVREKDFALNPFEKLALPYLHGTVLDMGCGLGNLSIEAARRGCSVLALDASPNAIDRIKQVATEEALSLKAELADFEAYRITELFDTVIAIGLFMFFPKQRALELLTDAQLHVSPGGIAIVNVMIEGTTYLEMFEPDHYYLFGKMDLQEYFRNWQILESRHQTFEAPGKTLKEFITLIARKQHGQASED
jgi:tellurite methyltransferase